MRRRSLRVAVPPAVRAIHPRTGQGRVWHSLLRELDGLVRLRDARPGRSVRADVWVHEAHTEPPETGLPVLTLVAEAPWRMADVMPDIEPRFATAMEALARASVAASTRMICPSRAAAAQAVDVLGADPARLDVVLHGHDPAVFRPRRGGAAPAGPFPYVLFASQLHPRKNLPALREAMARLGDLPHRLVIVGGVAMDRADSADLLAASFAPLPDGRPVIRIDDPTDVELAELMSGADAFCLPSLFEGFGLTALEAMACGAPVVASDRGALPEVVAGAGLVVEPAPDALALALRRVLTDTELADGLRQAARARAATLTWAATARGWLPSLEGAAAGG
ncbi:MAG TPA: glycosyltransferase family 1 protein [Solirubrobacteraceae bacterium]|nr:glycosyltransferase family 1 protein [Solirubrobacteraceae bacterium]